MALKAAKALVRQWPHARAPDFDDWQIAIAAALAMYPPGIVAECADPRYGLAKVREFPPTVAAVHEWCAGRVEYYARWAHWQPLARREEKPDPIVRNASIGERLAHLARRLLLPPGQTMPRFKSSGPSNDELRRYYGERV